MPDKTMKIAVILSAYDRLSTVVNAAVNKSTQKLKGFEKFGASLDNFGNKAVIAGAASTAVFGKAIHDAEQSEVAVNRLNQVFNSMGAAHSRAARGAEEYASKLQSQIGVEDEAIMLVQAKLATFSNVINRTGEMSNAFNRATVLAHDLAAAGFGDASANAVQLGKALQDPIKGVNAMARAGLTFSEAEKKKIKLLVESGRLHRAQEIILRAVEKQVGGVAAKTATTASKAKIAWGEISEQMGKILLPTFHTLANTLINTVIPRIQAFIDKHPNLVKWVAAGGAALLVIGSIAKVVAFGISGLTSVFNFLIPVLKGVGTVFGWLGRIFVMNPIGLIITAIAVGAFLVIRYWSAVSGFFSRLWNNVRGLFSRFWNWFRGSVFIYFFPPILIFKYWDKIAPFFSGMWQKVKNIFVGAWQWVTGLTSRFYEAGKNIIQSVWNGIKAMVNKPIEAMKNMVARIRRFLPFSPAKEGALMDIHKIRLVETIAASIKPAPVVQAMHRIGQTVIRGGTPAAPAAPVAARASGGSIVVNFSPTINGSGGNNGFMNELKKYEKQLVQLIEEAVRKRERLKF